MVREFWREAASWGGGNISRGKIYCISNVVWHWQVGSNAVGCRGRSDAVIHFLLHTPQRWLPMFFSKLATQIVHSPRGICIPSDTWFIGPYQYTLQSAPRSAVRAGLTNVTNRSQQTDYVNLSVAIGCKLCTVVVLSLVSLLIMRITRVSFRCDC